mmetsp:Transcript_25604/g.19367  ORF Transcript_25604/g.19367 Transcript_25604/m.19367 type:complete len:115 (+) Transcript_25604:100-444(+)
MPVEKGILSMVVQHLPSPNVAQKNRLAVICPQLTKKASLLRTQIEECSQDEGAETVAYITKMQPFNSKIIEALTRIPNASGNSQAMIGFARVFSGRLKLGQKVHVIGAKHGVNG